MKHMRIALALLALGGIAACTSPTEPPLPQPDPDEREEPPTHGMTTPVSFAQYAQYA